VPTAWACSLAAWLLVSACASELGPPRGAPPARASSRAPAKAVFDPREYYERRALFVLEGEASYYADMFQGRLTANGERFDQDKYTAAHRSLPFGTIVRVTRRKTGDWVLVRINDRGPFGKRKRILDLSKQAARRLGILQSGITQVRAEILELGKR